MTHIVKCTINIRGTGRSREGRFKVIECTSDFPYLAVYTATLPWRAIPGYCERVGIDKYRVAKQLPGAATVYDQRPISRHELLQIGFEDVTSDYGTSRFRVVHRRDAQMTLRDCEEDGYELVSSSAPNEGGEVSLVFRKREKMTERKADE